MPDPPPPERLTAALRLARIAARKTWRRVAGELAQYQHGLDLDDLEASATEAVLRALPRHDGREGDAYLYRSALGGALDVLRKADPLARTDRERRREAGETTVLTDPLETLAEWVLFNASEQEARARSRVERRDAARMVRAALDDLGPEDRSLLARIYFDDVLPEHVARERGVTPAYLGRLHHRALRRLEHALVRRNGRDVMQE